MEETEMNSDGIQTKEFQCPICNRYFSRKFTLDMHLLIHQGVKPHPCPFCDKCFRQKGTLMRHKALHSSINLFHCRLCNRGFRQKNIFSHHLKHRHNVSTETLDRRKYRTQMKDYQSIMDTLPSFVLADSTAIASSEKHLDAMLLESLQRGSSSVNLNSQSVEFDPSHFLASNENSSPKMLPDSSSACSDSFACNPSQLGSSNLPQSFKYECGMCLKSFAQFSMYTIHVEKEHNNSDALLDSKPIINLHISDTESISSDMNELPNCHLDNIVSLLPNNINPDIKNEGHLNYSPPKVSSSSSGNANFVAGSHSCIPCQIKFATEEEFECHIKTHVQSVLVDNGDSDISLLNVSSKENIAGGTTKQNQFKSTFDSSYFLRDVPPLENASSHTERRSEIEHLTASEDISDETELQNECSLNVIHGEKNVPMQINNNLQKNRSPTVVFLCPFCREYCENETSLLQHTKEHIVFRNFGKHMSASNNCLPQTTSKAKVSMSHTSKLTPSSGNDPKCIEKAKQTSSPTNFKLLNETQTSTELITVPQEEQQKSNSDVRISCGKYAKIYVCNQCPRILKSKIAYVYHTQMHLKPRSFSCQLCKKYFSNKHLLLRHTRSVHMPSYQCNKCSKVFHYYMIYNSHCQNCDNDSSKVAEPTVNVPMIDICKLLSSNLGDVVGVIPIDHIIPGIENANFKVGIPLVSLSNSDLKLSPFKCVPLNDKLKVFQL